MMLTYDIILALSILAVAVLLFVTEKLRSDVVALLVLLALALTGLLTPERMEFLRSDDFDQE